MAGGRWTPPRQLPVGGWRLVLRQFAYHDAATAAATFILQYNNNKNMAVAKVVQQKQGTYKR